MDFKFRALHMLRQNGSNAPVCYLCASSVGMARVINLRAVPLQMQQSTIQ